MWFGLDTWTYWWHLVKRMSSAQLPLLARKPAWNRSKCNPVVSVVPRMMASLLIYSQIELPPCGAWSQVLAACAMQATDLHQHPSKVGFWLGNGTAMYEYSYVQLHIHHRISFDNVQYWGKHTQYQFHCESGNDTVEAYFCVFWRGNGTQLCVYVLVYHWTLH